MKTFVASDTHFGHKNIIRFCDRPFVSVEEMNDALIERWNSRVSREDTVYFLGDFAMGPNTGPDFVTKTLSALNGTIRIVLGNHDMPSKWGPGLVSHIEHARKGVEVLGKEDVTIQHDGKTFVLFHYPMEDWDGKFHGAIHLHGHCHGRVTSEIPAFVDSPAKVYKTLNARWLTSNVEPATGRFDVGVDSYGGPVELTGDLRYLYNPKGWE